MHAKTFESFELDYYYDIETEYYKDDDTKAKVKDTKAKVTIPDAPGNL